MLLLRDTMADSWFEAGECVFEQGDASDCFYVITEGEVRPCNGHVTAM